MSVIGVRTEPAVMVMVSPQEAAAYWVAKAAAVVTGPSVAPGEGVLAMAVFMHCVMGCAGPSALRLTTVLFELQ